MLRTDSPVSSYPPHHICSFSVIFIVFGHERFMRNARPNSVLMRIQWTELDIVLEAEFCFSKPNFKAICETEI